MTFESTRTCSLSITDHLNGPGTIHNFDLKVRMSLTDIINLSDEQLKEKFFPKSSIDYIRNQLIKSD